MTSPALHNKQRKLAAQQGAANPEQDRAAANQYELQLMQLAEHRRTLKGIQSIERKIDAKRNMLSSINRGLMYAGRRSRRSRRCDGHHHALAPRHR